MGDQDLETWKNWSAVADSGNWHNYGNFDAQQVAFFGGPEQCKQTHGILTLSKICPKRENKTLFSKSMHNPLLSNQNKNQKANIFIVCT